MRVTRRDVLKGTGALLATNVFALEGAQRRPRRPHYMVFLSLRGGYDAFMSVNAQDQRVVKENIHCGYRADERVQSAGSGRLYGPLIGELLRHDQDLCLVHGVRSDTTAHPNGIEMLVRGSIRAHEGKFTEKVAEKLSGDAPIPLIELTDVDGELRLEVRQRPSWAQIRSQAHLEQVERFGAVGAVGAVGANDTITTSLAESSVAAERLARFLDDAHEDAGDLSSKFVSTMGGQLRTAFQAVRGNWARVIDIATWDSWFDSHSDNDRFQRELQPLAFADIATFVDLLKHERNAYGPLFDQTTVAVFSEFGRFPRLNGELGKDHWPENSWVLFGKGIRGGITVGATDTFGKGLPIDFSTGQVRESGGRPIFLDSAFATLYRTTGANPVEAGYERDTAIDAALDL